MRRQCINNNKDHGEHVEFESEHDNHECGDDDGNKQTWWTDNDRE